MRFKLSDRASNYLALLLFVPAFPFLRFAGKRRACLRGVRSLLDRAGVTVVANDYYEPVFTTKDIFRDPAEPRCLAGVDWNLDIQEALLKQFNYGGALRALDGRSYRGRTFRYDNGWFGPGDAEALYSMIRHFKPRRIVEIGCGQSTLVALFAIEDARSEHPQYHCQQICFEPFENPWLEDLGIEVRRKRIERSDPALFRSLSAGDIVFIDSSHTVRPMGDVEFEFLHVLPILSKGVIVHVHDIFSPRDYPSKWLKEERHFWSEQYILEAFLSFNRDFEIICAMNDLTHRGSAELKAAFPVLAKADILSLPASFWFRRS